MGKEQYKALLGTPPADMEFPRIVTITKEQYYTHRENERKHREASGWYDQFPQTVSLSYINFTVIIY